MNGANAVVNRNKLVALGGDLFALKVTLERPYAAAAQILVLELRSRSAGVVADYRVAALDELATRDVDAEVRPLILRMATQAITAAAYGELAQQSAASIPHHDVIKAAPFLVARA